MLLDEMKYDRRIVDRNIRKGMLSQEEYAKYLKKLPDVEENTMLIPAAQETSDPSISMPTTDVEDEEDDF